MGVKDVRLTAFSNRWFVLLILQNLIWHAHLDNIYSLPYLRIYMKTTIEMPDDLFRKAKAVAALRGQSMKDFITQLLTREIGAPIPPTANARKKAADAFSRELETLAAQVRKEWKTGLSATDAVREQRRN